MFPRRPGSISDQDPISGGGYLSPHSRQGTGSVRHPFVGNKSVLGIAVSPHLTSYLGMFKAIISLYYSQVNEWGAVQSMHCHSATCAGTRERKVDGEV